MSGCKTQSGPSVMATPYAAGYNGKVVVDPVTRIEGHYRVEVELENGYVKNAWTSAQLFRGLELILKGRDPRDASMFTQRSCGVCTNVHALASIRCVDNAVKVTIPENATLIRNLVQAAQYLHDHIVHFYHLHALDWVDVTSALTADPAKAAKIANDISPNRKTTAADLKAVQTKLKAFVDSGQLGIFTNAYFLGGHEAYYLPPEVNLIATAHYLEALKLQVKAARATAVFGAKNPHTQFMVTGGVTCYDSLRPERIEEFRQLWKETTQFVKEVYIPDLLAVASYYKDWAAIGGTTNFMACGEFPTDEYDLASRYMPPGVIFDRNIGKPEAFDQMKIEEHVARSWYKGDEARHPWKGVTEPQYTSLDDLDGKYSWFKAPRYDGRATEVGPLAHCLVAYAKGVPEFTKTVDMVLNHLNVGPEALFSTLGRTAARGIETAIIAEKMGEWIDQLQANVAAGRDELYTEWEMPDEAYGVGWADVPRGALSHWIHIKNKKIENFQLVVPSTWNLCPRDAQGGLSPVEEALIGTPIADPKRPVEILRTVHSYDPCIACGVHVIDSKTNEVHKFRIV
ncbi:nickel-dependent hydrogenase large subunit [Desulfohalovibrio reitneri]|uniref:nickel-dependent hydrogenase large subunit n=1 Tax=Desulfohalovibrio reitneri TaxID=1307759 RepID=UPI0004A6F67C|nr:nickel-dependent hydrogenase large subunit [Desulfohalovibrio reitneri]